MGVWSPAFHHQFLDGNLLNFSAAPGQAPLISFEADPVRPTPPAAERGFPVRRGNRFDRKFNAGVFGSVIGADIKVDIVFPPGAQASELLGNVVLGSNTIRMPVVFVGADRTARIQLIVDNFGMHASVEFDPAAPLRLQARWHVHGQGQIWVNGTLRGYEPSLAAGNAVPVDGVAFGHHDTSGFAPTAPAFLIRQIVVKLLREEDGVRALDQLQQFPEPSPLDVDCRRQLKNFQAQVLTEMRTLMQTSITSLTHSWTDGSPDEPYTREAVLAHGAASAAARSFVQLMIGHPDGNAAAIKDDVDVFLKLIRANDPTAYDAAISRLKAMAQPLDQRCLAQLQPFVQAHEAEMKPITDLLTALWTTMQAPGTP